MSCDQWTVRGKFLWAWIVWGKGCGHCRIRSDNSQTDKLVMWILQLRGSCGIVLYLQYNKNKWCIEYCEASSSRCMVHCNINGILIEAWTRGRKSAGIYFSCCVLYEKLHYQDKKNSSRRKNMITIINFNY